MRYSHSKEQSAELLRIVLAHMGQHDAAFNPLTYTVWFEYAAGINAQLNAALDELLQTRPRLNTDDLQALYHAHVAEVDPQVMHRMGSELQRVMSSLANAAGSAGNQAGEFGGQLETLVADLQSLNSQLMTPSVKLALEGSARVRDSAQALEAEVKNSQSEIRQLQNELIRVRDEVLRDALTQVLNRKGFDQQLADMLRRPPLPERVHALVMFDLDHFKKVNDNQGHVMGDRVLQALGEVLKSCVAPDSGHCVARYGGEEFAMLLPDTTPEEGLRLAELVRVRTKALKIRDRRTQAVVLTVTVSGGMALMLPGEEAAALTARADAALYRSKHEGRDRITCA